MFSFERSNFKCLATLAFVSVPYRVDLYIIPRTPNNVNTFFVTFLTNIVQTLGSVAKKSTLYTGFAASKISPKKLFFEEPIWLLLLKEINLTWSRVLAERSTRTFAV